MAEQGAFAARMSTQRGLFRKALVCGISRSAMPAGHWRRLEALSVEQERVGSVARVGRRGRYADALFVDIGVPVAADVIAAAPDLRYIGVFGTGFDNVDLRTAKRRRITVTNVPGYATQSVAEFTIRAILERLNPASARREGGGRELRGRRVGVVGMGRIGKRVAQMARDGFAADVTCWSRTAKPSVGFERVGLDHLLRTSEVISLHLALNEGTRGIIGARRVAALQPSAVLVNFASAGLVAQPALLRRLTAGELWLCIDHADEVEAPALRAMRRLPNVRIYRPIAIDTQEAAAARAEVFVSNAERFLAGRRVNVVDGRGNA